MTHSLRFDRVVIGAGVVGLAAARAAARAGKATLLVEAGAAYGTGISARSSEVIHGGMYYPPGSLKARLCVAGNRALYAYCAGRGVALRRLGKLIVAVGAGELADLEGYQRRAHENGVHDLAWLDQAGVRALEPALAARAALFSPSTGIVDSHALMTALLDDFNAAGGLYVARTPVVGGQVDAGAGAAPICLQLGGADPCTVQAASVVNAAGMGAPAVAASLDGLAARHVPGLYYAVGHYYALSGTAPFRHLVYPLPVAGGLGVHLTLDLAGRARFGPDLGWRDSEDYRFDSGREADFYAAIRRYWPGLRDGTLVPAYTGIRPKLWGPACPDQDFLIQDAAVHGVAGLVNLFGIESPGLTACLAIAEHIGALLGDTAAGGAGELR